MNKKTLGIITFNRASNYGAVLQAYALKCVCEDMGYEVHIINYTKGIESDTPAPLKEFLRASNKKSAAFKLCRKLLSVVGDQKRWNAFVDFRNRYLDESKICTTGKEVAALGYDVYVVGSDQIWNYNITGGVFDPVYFGDIPTEAQCVVYAASAHDTPFPLDMEQEFKRMLEQTPAKIGIREQKLSDYVGDITGIRYPTVLDPTLLAGRDIMEKTVKGPAPKSPYILIYQIDANPASDISVKTLERRFGKKVYTMTVPRLGSVHGRKGTAGPECFMTLLKNADFLVTNSFHGIALSLLLEKQFYVYENGGVMTRIDSLLKAVGLNDRKVKMVADIDTEKIIDFTNVRSELAKLRCSSMDYLKSALDGKGCAVKEAKKADYSIPKMVDRKKADCSGCTACFAACPVSAIKMEADTEGFLYPVIDKDTCINCGSCDKVCGFVPTNKAAPLPKAYGIKHKDEATRISSRSGAAFVAFSDIVLSAGGVVYGAAMAEDHTVSHIRAESGDERDRMKTAKYVQSAVGGVFENVINDLKSGRQVLFSGTPCQVSGLVALLDSKHIDKNNLFTCDLVCHGVPSPAIWNDYLKYIENKYGSEICIANFRDKAFGWDSHCESFVMASGKKIVSRDYTDLFYEHIMLRPSCHNCHFANVHRVSDLTLADFWGIEKNDPSFDDNKGVSLVLASTQKGEGLLQSAKPSLEWFECDIKNCIQPTLVKPSAASARREMFFADYKQMEFGAFVKKYVRPLSSVGRVKRALKQIMYRLGIRNHP